VIEDRVAAVRERIARAAARAGRRADEVTLVAVAKTFPAEAVRRAFEAGVRDFGENKVQEAEAKLGELQDLRGRGARFHLVGHLQGNKARKALGLFDLIHSIDSIELGQRLERLSAERKQPVEALVQVELGDEASKHGLDEPHLFPALATLRGFKQVRVRGLMTLPPLYDDVERVRPHFRRLRELAERAHREQLLYACELSMGMSHDLEVAIEEGATLVRVGTAIFGERAAATR
jgi:hypothetical protein